MCLECEIYISSERALFNHSEIVHKDTEKKKIETLPKICSCNIFAYRDSDCDSEALCVIENSQGFRRFEWYDVQELDLNDF